MGKLVELLSVSSASPCRTLFCFACLGSFCKAESESRAMNGMPTKLTSLNRSFDRIFLNHEQRRSLCTEDSTSCLRQRWCGAAYHPFLPQSRRDNQSFGHLLSWLFADMGFRNSHPLLEHPPAASYSVLRTRAGYSPPCRKAVFAAKCRPHAHHGSW